MACELDGGIVLVRPHGKARGDAANVDLPHRYIYWSHPDGALASQIPCRQANLGHWQ
jgi:hypothetical protein